MLPNPAISGLNRDPEPQARAQAAVSSALAEWRVREDVAELLGAFRRYADGEPLAALPALGRLFAEGGHYAGALVAPLVAGFCAALAGAPLGHVPLRHFTDGVISTLMIAREGPASLSLTAIDGVGLAARNARKPPASAAFSPTEEWDVVLAGTGAGRLVVRRHGAPRIEPIRLAPGLVLGREGAREALLFDGAEGALVLLRLQRRQTGTEPRCEVALADGSLLAQASSNARESRQEVAVALLGAMKRADAAPHLAELALEQGRGEGLRWQALRECLGIDTAEGFRALTSLARRSGDPLAMPAGALRAQLIEAHPVLAEIA